jgi:hypothetical protein
MALRRFVIERDIPKVGTFEREQLRGAAAKSNEVLHQLGPDIQWVESYVADNKTFCVYLAKDEAIIRKHAEISGFPATKITEVQKNDRSDDRSIVGESCRPGGRRHGHKRQADDGSRQCRGATDHAGTGAGDDR